MATIQVTPSELVESGRQLRAFAQDLETVHHAVEALRSAPLGSVRIQVALEDFVDDWRYGMTRLAERAAMTGAALLAAGKAYQEVDAQVARSTGG